MGNSGIGQALTVLNERRYVRVYPIISSKMNSMRCEKKNQIKSNQINQKENLLSLSITCRLSLHPCRLSPFINHQ